MNGTVPIGPDVWILVHQLVACYLGMLRRYVLAGESMSLGSYFKVRKTQAIPGSSSLLPA